MNNSIARSAVGFGPMQVDWEVRIDYERMRKERLARTTDAMREANVDFLIQLRLENARYSVGVKRLHWPTIQLGGLAVVVAQSSEPAIFVIDHNFASKTSTWFPEEQFHEGYYMDVEADCHEFAKDIREAFGAQFDDARVGVDIWPPAMLAVFQEYFPKTQFVDGQKIMLSAREIKTTDEINCMKLAYAISEAGLQAAVDILRPGVRECELVGECLRKMSDFGSEVAQCSEVVNSGPGSYPYRRFHTDRIVQHGDFVNMDFGGCFSGYFADFCRTFVCGGNPTPVQSDLLKQAYDLQMQSLTSIKPGVTPAELCAKFGRQMIGHGLGISAFEGPHMRASDTYELKPGMTFSIVTPLVGKDGIGGVHLEDEIVVTESGIDLYSTYPYTLN